MGQVLGHVNMQWCHDVSIKCSLLTYGSGVGACKHAVMACHNVYSVHLHYSQTGQVLGCVNTV